MRMTVLTIALSGLAAAAFADTPPATIPKLSKTCHAEVAALCPKSDDHKAHQACMAANQAKISTECQAQVKAHQDAKHTQRHSKPKVSVPTSPAAPTATQ